MRKWILFGLALAIGAEEFLFSSWVSAQSPLPVAARLPGLVVSKQLDFGTNGNVNTFEKLDQELNYNLSMWGGTTDLGSAYGCRMAARTAATAVPGQTVDSGVRFLTGETLGIQAYGDSTVYGPNGTGYVGPASAHNCLTGSFETKYKLPALGSALGKDVVWEFRSKVYNPVLGFWIAGWVVGTDWMTGQGPEVDVLESFYTPFNTPTDPWGWHGSPVGGTNVAPGPCLNDWPACLNPWKARGGSGKLNVFHTWTLVFKRDDTWTIYIDGFLYSAGTLPWRNAHGNTDAHFVFDCSIGNTGLWQVNNIHTPAATLPQRCDVDRMTWWKN